MTLLASVILRDTRANQPAATAVAVGTLFGVTDEGDIIERSNGATWEPYSPAAGGISATILDAKGDLIAASAADTAARVAVGTNGSSLRANSSASAGVEWQKNNLAASAAPDADNDVDEGYSIGSVWLDTTADNAYICLDATDGAAVWEQINGGGSGGGYPEGTSFPVSPSTDEKFYRTDRNLLYFYDGTRWLTVQQYPVALTPYNKLVGTALSVSTNDIAISPVPNYGGYDFYIEELVWASSVATTNNATHYWQIVLTKFTTAGGYTTIATFDTQADTPSVFTLHRSAVNALLGTAHVFIDCNTVKVSSPGNLICLLPVVIGRLVG